VAVGPVDALAAAPSGQGLSEAAFPAVAPLVEVSSGAVLREATSPVHVLLKSNSNTSSSPFLSFQICSGPAH
jgi:hypothetical protein